MLTFNEKLAIIESFPELERKNVSLGRVNFQFPDSVTEKKNIVYHLHPNGNGFVYAGHLNHYDTDEKGLVNIRDFSADQLRHVLKDAIRALSLTKEVVIAEAIISESSDEEHWVDDENHQLILVNENDAWNIYYGLNLDETFNSYQEAEDFLLEEGFRKK